MTAPTIRRPPPDFVPVVVRRLTALSPRMCRVTFGGDGVEALAPELPAASVRLLLPPDDAADLVLPTWDGNVFLLPDGRRAPIRTLTPLRVEGGDIDVAIVLHGDGRLSGWVERARPGSPAALSGPGRGYAVDRAAPHYVLAGDETALPAISQLIGHLGPATVADVLVEVAHADARIGLPAHPRARVRWLDRPEGAGPGDILVDEVERLIIDRDSKVWAAGEAAAMYRIRRHLFERLGHPRGNASVRGYWKAGRTGEGDDPG